MSEHHHKSWERGVQDSREVSFEMSLHFSSAGYGVEGSDDRGSATARVSDHRAPAPGRSTIIPSVNYGWQNSSPWEGSEESYIKQLLLALLPF